jgi:hypothetical protein
VTINNFYYLVKPLLPRRAQIALRRTILKLRLPVTKGVWPIKESAGALPPGWKGWPGGKQFAVVITHDVESSRGIEKCRLLAEIDLKYGFKSSFNIVPCKYTVPESTRLWLQERGFEIGVHDYYHDGKLYRSRKKFDERAMVINKYLKEWNAAGFRSAAMHHKLEWIAKLDIQYDCSTFDTDPFEPQPDGVNTIFPYWYQKPGTDNGYVEIPYTLPQDFTLFVIKNDKDCSIWKEKLKWIAEKGGMATVIIHPDYINFDSVKKNRVDEYSIDIYSEFLNYINSEYNNRFWNPLPVEAASFIRTEYSARKETPVQKKNQICSKI